jgi:hypothetical protein
VLLDSDLHVKIADFGLTRHSDETAAKGSALSFHFAAPEFFGDGEGEEEMLKRTEKTDAYAFACLYYEVGPRFCVSASISNSPTHRAVQPQDPFWSFAIWRFN